MPVLFTESKIKSSVVLTIATYLKSKIKPKNPLEIRSLSTRKDSRAKIPSVHPYLVIGFKHLATALQYAVLTSLHGDTFSWCYDTEQRHAAAFYWAMQWAVRAGLCCISSRQAVRPSNSLDSFWNLSLPQTKLKEHKTVWPNLEHADTFTSYSGSATGVHT